jgi:hypothetical protein
MSIVIDIQSDKVDSWGVAKSVGARVKDLTPRATVVQLAVDPKVTPAPAGEVRHGRAR